MMHISKHFTFMELTRTDHRSFLVEQADPPARVRRNLVRLCADILEPARELIGRLRVNSGYRCPGLNAAIGGSRTSAHMDGLAADVYPLDVDIQDAYTRLAQSSIPYDQLIFELGRWIHVGAAGHGHEPRRQRLAMYEPGHYVSWSIADPRFRAA